MSQMEVLTIEQEPSSLDCHLSMGPLMCNDTQPPPYHSQKLLIYSVFVLFWECAFLVTRSTVLFLPDKNITFREVQVDKFDKVQTKYVPVTCCTVSF